MWVCPRLSVHAPIFGPPRALILSFRCFDFKARYAHAFNAENPPDERCKIAHKLSWKERAKAWTDFTGVWQEWSMVDVELGAWRRNRQKRKWSSCLRWLKTTMCMIRPWRLIASDRISQRSAHNMDRFADEVGKEFGVLLTVADWHWIVEHIADALKVTGLLRMIEVAKKANYGAQWTLADWKERWGETRFALPQNCAEPREASGGHRLVQAFRTNSGQCCGVANEMHQKATNGRRWTFWGGDAKWMWRDGTWRRWKKTRKTPKRKGKRRQKVALIKEANLKAKLEKTQREKREALVK